MHTSKTLKLLVCGALCGYWSTGMTMAMAPKAPAGPELVLVKNGADPIPIVVFQDAPPLTRQAADELSDYIEKVSGARPDVIEGCPDPVPEHAIWVGYQPHLDKLFAEIDFNFRNPEEILVACDGNHLVIAGRDRWDPDHMVITDGRNVIEGFQYEYGTANAVYTFIQDYLDVRWIWPGELGEDIIRKDTLAFAPFEYRYHPQIRSRGGIFNYSRLGRNRSYGRSHDWTRLQRLQLDSLIVGGGHGFGTWWNRFHEDHPEYFALQPDGTRSGFPSPNTTKMCKSNPGLWDQWMAEVARQLEENPVQTVFDASANDSWASGYCVCENCRAWDHPDGELRIFHWSGLNQEYVALADRQVTLANTLGRMLKAKYPDKDYYVKIMAYGHSRPAPIEAVPDDNVLIVNVANFLTRPYATDTASTNATPHRDQFAAWAKVAPNIFWRPNKSRKMSSMPDIPVKQTIKDIRFAADNHCIGIYIDMVWEHWA
ncbi:MAG: DUF4838 domain-containing protein [Lentisphaerae bacterium]|nr:DUF4838 domain-containing protein [Lentisphaerota bacterium]